MFSLGSQTYDQTHFLEEHNKRIIKRFDVISHTPDEKYPHAVLQWEFIAVLDDTTSVSFALNPGHRHTPGHRHDGILLVRSVRTHPHPTNSFSVPLSSVLSAKQFLDLLLTWHRDAYRMKEPDGNGSLWWCQKVMGDMERVHAVPKGSQEKLRARLGEVGEKDKGHFYWLEENVDLSKSAKSALPGSDIPIPKSALPASEIPKSPV